MTRPQSWTLVPSVDVSGDDNVSLVDTIARSGNATITGLDITLAGPVNAINNDIIVTADNNIASSAALGGLNNTDNITLRANTGWVNATDTISADGTANLWAGQDITTTATVDATTVLVNGGNDVALATILAAAGGADIDAGAALTLNGDVDANTGTVTIDAGGLITHDAAIGSDNNTASVTIASAEGSLDSNNTIDSVGLISITTGANVDLANAVTAGTSIAVDAGGTVDAAAILDAGTSAAVSGDDTVSLVDTIARSGNASITGLDVTLAGPVNAINNDIIVTADNNIASSAALGGLNNTNNVTLRANTGWINSSAGITAVTNASLWAGDAITTTAAVTANGVTVNGGADVALAEINALAGGADIDAGNDLTLNGEVDAQTGAVTIDAGGLITQGAAVGGDNDTATVAITSTGGSLDSNNTIDAVASVAITTGQNG